MRKVLETPQSQITAILCGVVFATFPALAETQTDDPPVAAAPDEPFVATATVPPPEAEDAFTQFTPSRDPIDHTIDYSIWDFALKSIVISMGPSDRTVPIKPVAGLGTRIRQGHNSRYRLEGTMVGFSFLDEEVIASLTEYREDLQRVAETLDISSLPRNEQLAYWINLHNVAMMEQIALEWPVRQPGEIEIGGVPLNDAKFITLRGIAMSPRDIRERIVFPNWKNPKVIYGFWRGEIGGPALERDAFTGDNVSSLLDLAAEGFVNSLRGTQKSGDRLDVSTLYDEVRRFYFADFEADVRAHLADYANVEVAEILNETATMRASIREQDIADLSGGSRGASYLASSRPGVSPGMAQLLAQRQQKLEKMKRKEQPTGRVIFSNIDLPGDPPNKNAVE